MKTHRKEQEGCLKDYYNELERYDSYISFNMDRQKCLLIPVLICVFTIIIFFFQTDKKTNRDFSYLGRLLSIYRIRIARNFSKPPYKRMLNNNVTSNVITTIAYNNENISELLPKTTLTKLDTTTTVTPIKVTSQTRLTSRNSTGMQYSLSQDSSKSTQIPTNIVNTIHYLCPHFLGGLGNILFIFAAHFGAAMSKGMPISMTNDTELYRVFKLNVVTENSSHICKECSGRSAKLDCAFDENLMKFNATKNIRLSTYIQSWKYFYDYRDSLRKELVFRENVQSQANELLTKELKDLKIKSRKDVVLIGVHIRRGDMVNHSYGYNVATPEYLSKAVQYYENKYKNTIFIVSSLDMKWTQDHFPKNSLVRYVNHEKREVTVALLSSCDHTITTVGSFGWWVGWLTGGEVTYYKWPAKEGSELRKQYSKDFSDFFYPGWIGF